MWIEIWMHVNYALLVIGLLKLGQGKRIGFLIQGLGCASWMVTGWHLDYNAMIAWNILLALVSIGGFITFDKQRTKGKI